MQDAYDYIILGAGLAGYTMALRMVRDPSFKDKTIALIDSNFDKGNDRTWCFWESQPDIFESTVSYRWEKILVKGCGLKHPISITPYSYKKVEGEDFYAFAKAVLSKHSNCTFIEGKVVNLKEDTNTVVVVTKTDEIHGTYVLNSLYTPEILAHQKQNIVLQQHFIGWTVKTKTPVFDPSVATYMDFSIPQRGNCRFMYVLPTTAYEALLEYTLFSKERLPKSEYEDAIVSYLQDLGVSDYEITATEQGSIPMTTYNFTQHNTHRIIHIGTAGGWTKASTGYTFKHTLRRSEKLIDFLKTGASFTTYKLKNRWTFYDAVLLDVLDKHNEMGAQIFTQMFRKGTAGHIFRFLDEESSLWDEFKVIRSAPKMKFIAGALRVLFERK